MIILLAFAFLAGAGTALSPCVLPRAAGAAVRRRRRAAGAARWASCSGCRSPSPSRSWAWRTVVDGVGLGSDPLRDVAVVVLLVFGIVLLLPERGGAHRGAAVAARALRPALDRRRLPLGPARGRRARLRLHALRQPDPGGGHLRQRRLRENDPDRARLRRSARRVVLLALTLGGRRLFDRVRPPAAARLLQRVLGTIMILTALAIATNQDVNFDQFVAQHIPNVNLTASLECSSTVTGRLHEITGHQPKFAPANGSSACEGSATDGASGGAQREPGDAARRRQRAARRSAPRPNSRKPRTGSTRPATARCRSPRCTGRVVLVDFWTYTCINCIRTLPYLKAWDAAYRNDGPDDRRRRDAGVRLRARRLERVQRDRPVRPALPGRAGQQHGHLERLRQRGLARRLPDRRPRAGALHGGRRGRLLADRNGDPRAARRSRLQRRRARATRPA